MKKQTKWCWVATEIKNGWRLKLAYGSKDYNLAGLILKTVKEIEMVTSNGDTKIVFIHLKNTKYPE